MASAVVELNKKNDLNPASKSGSQHAAVENLLVRNPCDEKNKEVGRKCNHFSIRGYVSEVRKREPKLCYPFTLQDSIDPKEKLPPMVIPNFRWWRCITCVPEARNDVNADASIVLVRQSSKVSNADRVRIAEASTSNDSNDNIDFAPVSADRKGKGKAHVNNEIPLSSGCENVLLKVSLSQQIPHQTLGQINVDPPADNEVQFRSKCNQNGTTEALHKDCRASRTDVGPSEGYMAPEGVSPNNAVAGIVNWLSSHSQAVVNLPDLNECGGELLYEVKNKATVSGNNINPFCEDDDDYLGAERRKRPKVRLLSELLGIKETQNPSKGKKKILSSASSQDEGLKSMELRGTHGGTKKIVGSSESFESEYETESDDVSTEKISKALAKRRCKFKENDPLLERRNKRIKMDRGDSSSLFQQKIKPKSSSHEKLKTSEASHEKLKTSEELPRNHDFLTRVSEQKSVLTKKRGRVPQVQKESTLIPSTSRIPKGCGTTRKDGETENIATENVLKASENVHYVLSSHSSKENDQQCVPRIDEPYSSSFQGEHILLADKSVKKDQEIRNIGETSVIFRETVTDPPSMGKQSDEERRICVTANPSEKKTGSSEANGYVLPAQRMPMQVSNSTANQKDLTHEVRGRIQDIDINSIPTDDKTNDQGPGDDIPMDIVELMAKNQYERHLDDPKNNNDSIKPAPLFGTHVRQNGIYGSNGNHVQNFVQSNFLSTQNSPSTGPRFPLFNEHFGHYSYNKNNNLGYQGPPGENPVSACFLSPSQAQECIRPYSARGVPPNNWNGNINAVIGQRYPPGFLQTVDSYQKHSAVIPSQSINDSHRVWSSGMASRMPLGITNPRMISQSATVLNKGRIHHQSSGTLLNFSASEKLQNLSFSNTYNSENPESSGRSVDVNEAIPAMHLLSLMQNAAKIQSTDLSLGPQKVVGPNSSRYPFSKSNSRISTQDNSCHPCYPTALPTARPFPLAYQIDGGNIGRTSSGFVGAIPLTLRGQRNMETSQFACLSGDHGPLKRRIDPHDKKRSVVSMSKRTYMNNPIQEMKDSSNLKFYGAGVKHVVKSLPRSPVKMICRLNQNPSEFNDLKLVARYMIGPEDLKRRKIARDKAPRPRGNSKRQNAKVNKPIPSVIAAKS